MTEMRDALRTVATGCPEVIRADKVDVHIFNLAEGVELLVNVHFWADATQGELEARDWFNREILRTRRAAQPRHLANRAVAERPRARPRQGYPQRCQHRSSHEVDQLRSRAMERPGD